MKTLHASLVSLLLLLVPNLADAKRPAPLTEEETTFSQVYEAPGLTKDQLFAASKMWIAQNFESADAVIEYEDKDEGTILGNGNMQYPCGRGFSCMVKADWRTRFTMKVETKDGKIRLTFSNIRLTWPASYSSGISTPAANLPIRDRADLDKIKPELLKFGDQIVASAEQVETDSDW